MASWAELEAALQGRIQGHRLTHTYGVLGSARELAHRFGADVAQAEVAALMHDYAKQIDPAELLAAGRSRGLVTDPAEEIQPQLLHGPVAAALLQEQGLVTDPAVLDAIRWHTTGRPGMSLLEKVIYVADVIEPGRSFPGVEKLRAMAQQDLDGTLLLSLGDTIKFVVERGALLHLASIQSWNWLLTAARTQSSGS